MKEFAKDPTSGKNKTDYYVASVVRISTEETSRDINEDITRWVPTTFSISLLFNPRSELFLLGAQG